MGTMGIIGMLEQTDIDTALQWHLQHNHYPPIPVYMVEVAKKALDAASDEDWEREIELPENVTSRRYGKMVPANAVIDELHLDAFVDALNALMEEEE